ncbi:MAG: hypothetical protein ACOC0N_11355 [Chroococcales cyanobacterium]
MSKKSQRQCPLRQCPLSKEQQETVKKVADTVDKHKQIARKLSPF